MSAYIEQLVLEVGDTQAERAPLGVTVVEDEGAFDSLEKDWNELSDRTECTIYQTYEWQRTWWEYFGQGRQLHLLIFKEGDRTVGIIPMFREKVRALGVKAVVALMMSGSEESEYIDILTDTEHRQEVLKAFVSYLSRASMKWDFFEMRDLSARSETMKFLPGCLEASGFGVYSYNGNINQEVPLPSTWEGFLQHIGGNLRYQLKKKTDRLKKNYPVEVETVNGGDEAIEAAVQEFARIHGGRWESLGYENAFGNEHFLDFHVEVARRFARRGWLRMFFLKVNGTRVAVNFDFNFHDRIYFYQGNVYAPEDVMKYSPGFLLRCIAIEQGIAEGMKIYDMGRGHEAYKTNDFKCVASDQWLIRATNRDSASRIRFKLFLFSELLGKIPKRIQRDYREFRRLSMTKKPSVSMLMSFFGSKAIDVLKLFRYNFSRLSGKSKD